MWMRLALQTNPFSPRLYFVKFIFDYNLFLLMFLCNALCEAMDPSLIAIEGGHIASARFELNELGRAVLTG